ncbi:MAG: rRNA maturation RNase YbeY [Acidimicrobiia bacterium]
MIVEVTGADRSDIDEVELAAFAASILEREFLDRESGLSVAFVDAEAISSLNAQYLGGRGPTDVLAFPIEDAAPDKPPTRRDGDSPLELGDIFICVDVVDAHAKEYGVTFTDELHLMVTHGVLHILGWDHQTGSKAEAMEVREAEHLATIGMVRR